MESSPTVPARIDFDPEVHRALEQRAGETARSISELVNEAVRLSLELDAQDFAAFDQRAGEPNLDFEDVVQDLRKRGKL